MTDSPAPGYSILGAEAAGAAATDSCAVMMMTTTGTATQLAKVDACGMMNLAVGNKVLWYTDRAHNLVKSVAIAQ